MKSNTKRFQPKRLGAMLVAAAMLMQGMVPAYATVSQVPAIFIAPPDTNVMFTLDDSGSMARETIPDSAVVDTNIWSSTWNSTTALDKFKITSQQWRYFRSPSGNPLYYNPNVTYKPWPFAADDTKNYPPASPTAACYYSTSPPLPTTLPVAGSTLACGTTRNLAARVVVNGPDNADKNDETKGYWPATYFRFVGPGPLLPNGIFNQAANPNNATGQSYFQKVEIRPTLPGSATAATYTKAASRTDCAGAVCTYAEEIQNFANYFTYYRTRSLMAKGGAAQAFAMQGTNLRVGFGTINAPSSTVDGATTATVTRGVRKFENDAKDSSRQFRKDFYTRLYAAGANNLTPLRLAADNVGKYFQRTGAQNPWADDPANTSTPNPEYTCRKSFHILSTDGFWNGSSATSPASNNNDNFTSGTGRTPPNHRVKTPAFPGGREYFYGDSIAPDPTDPLVGRFTVSPFRDGTGESGNRLADVAAYYWREDLRPSMLNEVPPSSRDPAFWQHLTTFTVGLGITGTGQVTKVSGGTADLSTEAARELLIKNKVPLNWTVPNDNLPSTGDDLIHAAMNGRGKYFSATDPAQLAVGLASALSEAVSKPGSLANLAVEAGQVVAGNDVFQATYNPDKWAGRVYAFDQLASGAVNSSPDTAVWEASNKMPPPAERNIFTWNPLASPSPAAVPFLWSDLNATQKTHLANDPTLLDYLRGSDAKEAQNGGLFRERLRNPIGNVPGGVLGDIVNGSPIKGPEAGGGFERLPTSVPGQSTYAAYRSSDASNTALDTMRKTLFVAANDGMLHAFDSTNGVERFAFVPNAVYSVPRSLTGTEAKLRMLSDPAYQHRMLVDGPPQIGDAYRATDWTTMLVGTTGAGARSVFAMDVKNPAVQPGGFDKSKILWELSEGDDPDLGYVINYPHIARMKSKSDGTGGAWVAIFGNGYDSANGQAVLFIRDLFTGAHVAKIPVGPKGGNGLSQPNFTVNNNREVTAIYAGDLLGNLWKFDVDYDNSADYKIAFGDRPLYEGSATQPITVMPEITFHPNGGTLVSFGTGKLFEVEDTAKTLPSNVNLNTQSLIGIWDKPGVTTSLVGKSSLVQQGAASLAAAVDASLTGTTTNAVDWTTKRGWYLDLANGGERVNVNPQQVKNVLLIVANAPDSDPCKSGGSSRLFALDPITGGAPNFAVFDANAAGGITAADKGYNVKSIGFAVLTLPTLQRRTSTPNQIRTEALDSRGKTGERLGGVENRPPESSNDCDRWLLAGGSDTSITGFDISVCSKGKPRISWRQLK